MHWVLGPGLLESVYQVCLLHELNKRGLNAERQVLLPVVYDSLRLDAGIRLDLVVEKQAVVELRAVEVLLPVHKARLPTYLKLSGDRLGLLVNFNGALLKQGMQRIGIGVICETWSFPSRHGGRNLLRKPLEMCCRRTGSPLSRE